MADRPRISVVMPLYNRADTVAAAIDSVLAQTFGDFELIVVDDGSTDGGAEIVESVPDRRLRLVRLPENRGGGAARNEGIRQARGEIVSFLDSDDLYLPHKLATVVATFERHPGLGGMIDSFRKVYPDEGGRSKFCPNPELEGREALLDALFDRRLWKSTSGISVTREAAIAAGMFDEALKRRQDFDFLIRLIRAVPVVSISEISWEKTYMLDSISADFDRFVPRLFDFWDRHPEYYANPAYRRGFAADMSRHLGKLLMRRRVRQAFSDAALVAGRIGWGGLIASLARGAGELKLLKRHRQDIRRGASTSAPAGPAAGARSSS